MLNQTQIGLAAQFITGHWRNNSRCIDIPLEYRPVTRADAYEVQAAAEAQSSKPLAGWKIAATSLAGQKHIGVDGPLLGRYIAERVVPSGGVISFGRNHMQVAEVEFAFKLASDVPPRATPYSEPEVFDAVASLHPAIEIPDSRYEKFETVGAAQLIADNGCADWLAIGEAMPDIWRGLDLAEFKPLGRVSGRPDVEGKGSNVLGSPRIAMCWAINELSAHGITAKAGQFVTTGTCVVPMKIAAGDEIEGDFGALGKITLRIGPQ